MGQIDGHREAGRGHHERRMVPVRDEQPKYRLARVGKHSHRDRARTNHDPFQKKYCSRLLFKGVQLKSACRTSLGKRGAFEHAEQK
jgi:hypothetical protein